VACWPVFVPTPCNACACVCLRLRVRRNTCANVLILPANDTSPDGMKIPDGPSELKEVDAIMENLAKDKAFYE
jgi:hypothetical protein